jgi:hypothetical protein
MRNVCDTGIIAVSAAHTNEYLYAPELRGGHATVVFVLDMGLGYYDQNKRRSWLMIDFQALQIPVTSYSVTFGCNGRFFAKLDFGQFDHPGGSVDQISRAPGTAFRDLQLIMEAGLPWNYLEQSLVNARFCERALSSLPLQKRHMGAHPTFPDSGRSAAAWHPFFPHRAGLGKGELQWRKSL